MEDSQYKTIEEQALQIVGTLNKLKEEIEGYKDARIETKQSLDSLNTLLGAVTDAASQLNRAAKDLRNSDYIKLHEELSEKTSVVKAACDSMQQNLDVITDTVRSMLESQQAQQEEAKSQLFATLTTSLEQSEKKQDKANKELLEKVSNLEQIIGRIDRNTQKGFGKERG